MAIKQTLKRFARRIGMTDPKPRPGETRAEFKRRQDEEGAAAAAATSAAVSGGSVSSS